MLETLACLKNALYVSHVLLLELLLLLLLSGCILKESDNGHTKSVLRGGFSDAPTTAIDTITTWRHAPQEHATKLWKNRKTAGLWGDKVASALSQLLLLLLLLAATSYQLSYGSDSLSHRKGMRAGSAVTWLETITAWQSLIFFGICKFWFLGIFCNYSLILTPLIHNDFPIWWKFQPNWSEGLQSETHHWSGESHYIKQFYIWTVFLMDNLETDLLDKLLWVAVTSINFESLSWLFFFIQKKWSTATKQQ